MSLLIHLREAALSDAAALVVEPLCPRHVRRCGHGAGSRIWAAWSAWWATSLIAGSSIAREPVARPRVSIHDGAQLCRDRGGGLCTAQALVGKGPSRAFKQVRALREKWPSDGIWGNVSHDTWTESKQIERCTGRLTAGMEASERIVNVYPQYPGRVCGNGGGELFRQRVDWPAATSFNGRRRLQHSTVLGTGMVCGPERSRSCAAIQNFFCDRLRSARHLTAPTPPKTLACPDSHSDSHDGQEERRKPRKENQDRTEACCQKRAKKSYLLQVIAN